MRSWCDVVVKIDRWVRTPEGAEEMATIRLPEEEKLENEEPRQRPRYWSRLIKRDNTVADEAECAFLR